MIDGLSLKSMKLKPFDNLKALDTAMIDEYDADCN